MIKETLNEYLEILAGHVFDNDKLVIILRTRSYIMLIYILYINIINA